MPKPQIHQSHLKMNCGVQLGYRYGKYFGIGPEDHIIPPVSAMAIGTAVHKGAEMNLKSKMETGHLMSLAEVQAIARDEFIGLWEAGLMLTEDEVANQIAAKGTATDMVVKLSILHAQQLAPLLFPVAVEEKFVIKLKNFPYDIAGQIDVREVVPIDVEGKTELTRLWDLKTVKQTPGVDAARTIQMTTYSVAEEQLRGNMPDSVGIHALVKTKEPKLITIQDVPEKSWVDNLKHRLQRFADTIEAVKAGHNCLQPATGEGPTGWVCTKAWCGYWDRCKFWSGK